MRTKTRMTRTIMMSLVIILSNIFLISCAEVKNKEVEDNSTHKNNQKVEQPSMDIYSAVFMGNMKALEQHIQIGTDLNSKDPYGSTPLNIAITFGKTDIALYLINEGADINATNADASSPLHLAAFYCRTETVEALLNKGADKSLRNQYGSTALESVSGPFEEVKPIYLQLAKDLGPLGFKLDLERIELTRPVIVNMISK